MTVMDWIMGIGIAFGIALFLTYITYGDLESFVIWLTVAIGFMVFGGALPLWVLVLTIILLTIMVYLEFKSGGLG